MDDQRVARGDFPSWLPDLSQPEEIPPPERLWTEQEWSQIRLGHMSRDMDDKWHALVEGNRLYLHRSWTGLAVYEAEFGPVEGGWLMTRLLVTGDRDQYRRGSDEYESALAESIIESVLLAVYDGPGRQRWDRLRTK